MATYIKPEREPEISFDADFGIDIIKQVIGNKGCYFKLTTANTKVEYIWYNMDSKRIEIWGNKNNVNNASTIIEDRLFRIMNRMKKQKIVLNENSNKWLTDHTIQIDN